MTITAESRGWGPGWPHCNSSNIRTLVRKDGLRLPVNVGIIELVDYLIGETERRGYDVKVGQTWGYACRAIRGSQAPSNHSWGLAVDINAPTNPMGQRLITDMPSWMVQLWVAHMFRWGGSYVSRPDAMHMEFMGSPSDAARITASLKNATSPGKVSALPIYLHHGTKVDPYTSNLQLAEIQIMYNEFNDIYHIMPGKLVVDGTYGPLSAKWTSAFKEWNIKLQRAFKLSVWPNTDPTIGPVTYGALKFWTKH